VGSEIFSATTDASQYASYLHEQDDLDDKANGRADHRHLE
jgi:hypothetical protein